MTPVRITYIVAVCLFLIFATQVYLLINHFQTTRKSLTRESNAILEEAFRKDLNRRHKQFKYLTGGDYYVTPLPLTLQNTQQYSSNQRINYSDSMTEPIDLKINNTVSKSVPLNLYKLDSIVAVMLQARNINSKFRINIINSTNGKVLKQSDKNDKTILFWISSKPMLINTEKHQLLQLVLINPFGLLINRMGIILIISCLLSIICLLSFRFLVGILIKQKQLDKFKNEFLGTIAHELKRPVSSLMFNLDCLNRPTHYNDNAQRKILLNRSINATVEMNATINMIVALTKEEEGLLKLSCELFNLNELFDNLKDRLGNCNCKQVEIEVFCEHNETSVIGDLNLLTQCFANLIDNAIKYSYNQVLITITIRKTDQWIIVSIKDNGLGISEEKIPIIFNRHTRLYPENTNVKGFGIGLNYVKKIVEAHKGTVEVKSKAGEGSEFSVLLPI